MTKNIRLSSAFNKSELLQPTFRSFGAPSPLEIYIPPADDSVWDKFMEFEKVLFSNYAIPPAVLFGGIKVVLDEELEDGRSWLLKQFEAAHNDHLGVPYPYTEDERARERMVHGDWVGVQEFDKPPTAEERAEYNRRMGQDVTEYKAQTSFRTEPKPWHI
jgi:hypothetical protein